MRKIPFNDDWKFYKENETEGTSVTLPHDVTMQEGRKNRGMMDFLQANFPGGNYTYLKTYFFPEIYQDKTIYIEFEGVYKHATLYVNNVKTAYKAYGYSQFVVEITDYLRFGYENEIRVEIVCEKSMHNRWYAACGIYQPVSVYICPKEHIKPYGLAVKTMDLNPAVIKVSAETVGDKRIHIEIYEEENMVAMEDGNDAEMVIPDAKLWSDESPYLYTCVVQYGEEKISQKFGICKLDWSDAKKGFLVNGKVTNLRGGCIHNDNGIIGEVTNQATEERRVRNIKASGFNAIRMAHHPASKSLLDACDKYGLYVMTEAFDTFYHNKFGHDFGNDFLDIYELEFENMARSARIHPSVILYSVGNEITEIGTVKSKEIVANAVRIIKKIDDARPVTIGMNMQMSRYYLNGTVFDQQSETEWTRNHPFRKIWCKLHSVISFMKVLQFNENEEYNDEIERMDRRTTDQIYKILDINGYNYYSLFYERIHEYAGDKLILGTENYMTRNVHNWNKVKKYPYVIGDFVWTLQEHLGEVNCGGIGYGRKSGERKYPWITNYSGVIDLLGHATPVLHQYQLAWERDEGIYIASQPVDKNGMMPVHNKWKDSDTIESWSYDSMDGKLTYVEVYTNAPTAELLINGKSLGKKEVVDYRIQFENVIYESGCIEAVGYDKNHTEIYRNKLISANRDVHKLHTVIDRTELTADGQDMAFIDISVTDEKGIVHALPEHEISIMIEGPGILQGFGSAAPVNEEDYTASSHRTFHGKVMAVVRTTNEPGEITIVISSDNMESKEIKIISRK